MARPVFNCDLFIEMICELRDSFQAKLRQNFAPFDGQNWDDEEEVDEMENDSGYDDVLVPQEKSIFEDGKMLILNLLGFVLVYVCLSTYFYVVLSLSLGYQLAILQCFVYILIFGLLFENRPEEIEVFNDSGFDI